MVSVLQRVKYIQQWFVDFTAADKEVIVLFIKEDGLHEKYF